MSSVWNSFVVWPNYWMRHIRQFRQLSWLQLKQSSCCWSENCTWWGHYLIPQATHVVQFLVWEHRHPVCGEGVMVREAFRKYCKKSETIDHVKIYKCCRENNTWIQPQSQYRMHCHAHVMRTECLIRHYSRHHSDYLGQIIKVWD